MKKHKAQFAISLLVIGMLACSTLTNGFPGFGISSGSARERVADGMPMHYVPAGEFTMGGSEAEDTSLEDSIPVHTVYLDAYWIDETEVTNSMFADFLNTHRALTENSASFWFNPFVENARVVQGGRKWIVREGYEDFPVTGVTWYGAQAYCSWVEARLPTEAEWEKAARGEDARTYPWGEEVDCKYASFRDCAEDTTEAGEYSSGASPYGALDMTGNVAEWVQDWYEDDYYEDAPEQNPTGPRHGRYRVIRGGDFSNEIFPTYARLSIDPTMYTIVNPYAASTPLIQVGFRCAAAASGAEEDIAGTPAIFPIDACMQTYDSQNGEFIECVTGASIAEDNDLMIYFMWDAPPEDSCVGKYSDIGNENMYIVDDVGNRYDAKDIIEPVPMETCMHKSPGMFVFPPLDSKASSFIFYDDDNGIHTDPIPVTWKDE